MFLRVGQRVHNLLQATTIDLGGSDESAVVVHFGEDRGGGIPLRGHAALKVRNLFSNGEVPVIVADAPPEEPEPIPAAPATPAPATPAAVETPATATDAEAQEGKPAA